jgi:polyphosphate kinase
MPGLKVHAKIAFIKRRSSSGKMEVYGFLGTGNFNEITARIYADEGLFTANRNLLKEVDMIFKFLEKKSSINPFNHLLISQFNIIDSLKSLIDREIQHVNNGLHGRIILKLNNLEEKEMIDKLYEAGMAGVEITLIIRGICCLRPKTPGLSDNITVLRIVDSFLEHARIFVFNNNGEPDIYMGSADWMTRNLRHRIEVVFPVYDPRVREEILQMINYQVSDNTKARILDQDLVNQPPADYLKRPLKRSQTDFYKYLKKKYGSP